MQIDRLLRPLGSSAPGLGPLRATRPACTPAPQRAPRAEAARCSICSRPASTAALGRQRRGAGRRGEPPARPRALPERLLAAQAPAWEVAEGLETPVQAIYLLTLLGFLVAGAYLVARQVLIRRELEEAAKVLGDRIRTNSASSEDFFELGVILLRKKLFTQAVKNLEKARKAWDGEAEELAQVHNALGFAYFNMDKAALAVENYRKAVELQPGYVTAWNNLGDAYEKTRNWRGAYDAYSEALTYAPDNRIARERAEQLRARARAS